MGCKLTFKQESEFEVVNSYDEQHDECDTTYEKFKAGETIEVDVVSENKTHYLEIQFADGSVARHIPKMLFKLGGK